MQNETDINNIDKIPLTSLEKWGGYWSTLVRRKQKLHSIDTRQIFLGQVFTLFVTTGAGYFISQNTEALLLVGTSLLIYPVIAESLSSNAAVLVASLHHKLDSDDKLTFGQVFQQTSYSVFIGTCACLFLGLASGIIGVFLFNASFILAVQLAVLAGTLTGIIGLPLMVVVLFVSRRNEINPDAIAPPIETTIFNTVALVSIVVVSRLIL